MEGRDFLRANWHLLEGWRSDQMKGADPPEIQKRVPADAVVTALPEVTGDMYPDVSAQHAMQTRRSVRKFNGEPLSPEELSFLLHCTQGVRKVVGGGAATLRSVPSAGARHPFETYLLVNSVSGLDPGTYRYLPLDRSLAMLGGQKPPEKVVEACHGQAFCGECAVTFVWSVIPYRTEWRYGPVSHKVIAIDAGHLCQNLYLACTAAGLGTCGIGAYNQEAIDGLMGFDGEDEFTVYIAPVGRPA